MKFFPKALTIIILCYPSISLSVNGIWSATPADGIFSNSANWIGGFVPGYVGGGADNYDIATFGASSIKTISYSQNLWVGGFTFNASGYTFTQGAFDVAMFGDNAGGGGIVVNSGSLSYNINTTGYTFQANSGNYNNVSFSVSGNLTFTGNSTGGTNLSINSMNTNPSISINSSEPFTIGQISGFGSYTLNSAVSIGANNASTSVNASGSGTGSLTKVGTGTLTLLNTFSHSGGTTISAGSLQLGNNGSTGGLATNGTILNNATLIVNKTSGTTLNGVISGSGTLIKRGSAALTLGGANTFSGGTTLEAGTLSLSNNSALGTGSLTVAGNGNLQSNSDSRTISNNIIINNGFSLGFGSTNNITLSGNISGAGGISKTNSNTVFLTGINSYTGGTSISAGTIQGTTDSLKGNITNNAEIIFSQTSNGTYSNIMSGSGSVTKNGNGTVTLSGNNIYSGTTTINAGALEVTGSITSSVIINATAVLKGTGSVAGINSTGGSVAPGSSIGTLTCNGNVNLDANSTMQIEISPTSASLLAINGTANLNGTLNLLYDTGTYNETNYTILTANSVSGNFTSITSSNFPAGYTSTLQILSDKVLLHLQRQSSNGTISQRSSGIAQNVAIFMQNVQDGTPTAAQTQLYNSINAIQDTAQLNGALNQISPTVMGNIQSIDVHTQQQQQVSNRLAALHQNNYVAGDAQTDNGLWIRTYYQDDRQGNLKSLLGYKAHTSGIVLGYDRMLTNSITIGIAGNYAYSVVKSINYDNTATNLKTYLGIVYGSFEIKHDAYFDWLLSGGRNNIQGNRTVDVAPTYVTAIYDTFSQQYSALAIFGKTLECNRLLVTPNISANYIFLKQHGYNESNAGSIGMAVNANTSSVFTVGTGIKLSSNMQSFQYKYVPELHAIAYYDLKSGTQNVSSTFVTGGPSLATTSTPGRIVSVQAHTHFNSPAFPASY